MDDAERYLVLKMAELVREWNPPYDDKDIEQRRKNTPIELKYDTDKEMFFALYCK